MRNEKFDEKLLSAKVGDAAKLALRRGEPTFTRFLSEAERAYIERNVYYDRDEEKLLFFGGTDEAEYTVAGFFPAYLFYDENYNPEKDFPVRTVEARGSGFRRLSHRDFLGSLMALGIERETIGDIFVAEDGYSAYIVCLDKTADYLLQFFTAAANDKITCRLCDGGSIVLPEKKFETLSVTVASPRLDALLSSALNVSREEAARLVSSGGVSVDHVVCTDKGRTLSEGSLLSVRGYGRYRLSAFGDRNRRDRLRVTLLRYI